MSYRAIKGVILYNLPMVSILFDGTFDASTKPRIHFALTVYLRNTKSHDDDDDDDDKDGDDRLRYIKFLRATHVSCN